MRIYHRTLVSLVEHGALYAATNITIGPGQTLSLTANIKLSATDTISLVGTAQNPCHLEGNGFNIAAPSSPTWNGTVVIQYCTIHNLGSAAQNALDFYVWT